MIQSQQRSFHPKILRQKFVENIQEIVKHFFLIVQVFLGGMNDSEGLFDLDTIIKIDKQGNVIPFAPVLSKFSRGLKEPSTS